MVVPFLRPPLRSLEWTDYITFKKGNKIIKKKGGVGDEPALFFSLSDLNSAKRRFTISIEFDIYYGLTFIPMIDQRCVR